MTGYTLNSLTIPETGLHLVQAWREVIAGDSTYANQRAIAEDIYADPACVGMIPSVMTHRDSHPYEQSNRAEALLLLAAADPSGESYSVAHFSHWALGWVEYVTVNTQRADTVAVALAIGARLAEYPLLNEAAACALEWDANHPGDGECYSEDGDACPCHDEDESDA